jgi:hypothetical protein
VSVGKVASEVKSFMMLRSNVAKMTLRDRGRDFDINVKAE